MTRSALEPEDDENLDRSSGERRIVNAEQAEELKALMA